MRKPILSPSLYRLIYCSRNIIRQAVPGADTAAGVEREIRSILDMARRRNTADQITGALLFTASGFAQVLEGPGHLVERAFERISADPRHTNVTILAFAPTERRSFPHWSMGFRAQTAGSTDDPLAHLLADATFAGPRTATGGDVLRLLETVVHTEDDWVAA